MSKSLSKRQSQPVSDLSDQLGKLPPQAVELEETVLGAIILENNAFLLVKDFLEPQYFYIEAHQEIYAAVQSLYNQGKPHADMRMVVNELRTTGKIELIGGAVYIVELTNKLSSAANVEYHARIVIEHYVKRELIKMGSALHQHAYDDSADALSLLSSAIDTLKSIDERIYQRTGPAQIKRKWEETLLLTAPDEPPPIIHIDDAPVAWPGGHTLIVGKKKSRKTLFIIQMVTWYLKQNRSTGDDVLIFDTEQSKRHVFAIREKIFKLTGLYVPVFYLRGMSPEDRQEFITNTVAHWPTPPQLIINDGIRDMMNDINDPKESTHLITWLERLTLSQRPGQQYLPHVLNVLHLNKGDSNPRGHIGTELQNKADATIELALDERNNVTNVKCESSREKPFNPIAFIHDESGLPLLVTSSGQEALQEDDSKNRLHIVFEDGMLNYKELVSAVKINYAVGDNRAKSLIAKFRRDGWIIKTGPDRSPETKYKLMLSDNGTPHKPQPEQTQQNLFGSSNSDDLPF